VHLPERERLCAVDLDDQFVGRGDVGRRRPDRGRGDQPVPADCDRLDDGDVDREELFEHGLVAHPGDVDVVEGDPPAVDGLAHRAVRLERVPALDSAGLDQPGVDLLADAAAADDRQREVAVAGRQRPRHRLRGADAPEPADGDRRVRRDQRRRLAGEPARYLPVDAVDLPDHATPHGGPVSRPAARFSRPVPCRGVPRGTTPDGRTERSPTRYPTTYGSAFVESPFNYFAGPRGERRRRAVGDGP
jgi:hypothetical protein